MILDFSGGDDLFFAESSEQSDPNRLNFSRLAALGAQNDLRFTPAAAGEEKFEYLEFLNLESSLARPALGEGPRGAPRGVPALSLAPSLANQKKEVAVC